MKDDQTETAENQTLNKKKSKKKLNPGVAPKQAITPKWLRLPLLVVGMAFSAFGIALIAATNLGSTPISTVPLTITTITGISFGTTTFVVNIFFVLFQVLLLRKKFRLRNLLQLPSVLVFSAFIDCSVHLLNGFDPGPWAQAFSYAMLGTVLMSLGVIMQVRSQTIVQPGEGIVLAIALTFKKPFGDMKMLTDAIHVTTGGLIGWIVLGHIVQIREVTLVSALLVGLLVKTGDKIIDRLIDKRRHKTHPHG